MKPLPSAGIWAVLTMRCAAAVFAVSDAYNRYPLAVKLHASDLIATYLMEQGTSNVENGHPKTK